MKLNTILISLALLPVVYGSENGISVKDTGVSILTAPTGETSVNRLSVTNDGKIGIGTTSPSEKLSIYGKEDAQDSNLFGIYSKQSGTSEYQVIATIKPTGSTQNDGYFRLFDNGAPKVHFAANSARGGPSYVDNGGNFGIGTNTPTERLEINGGIKISNNANDFATTGGHIDFFGAQKILRLNSYYDDADGAGIEFRTGGTDDTAIRMTIAADGNVGIGTIDPTSILHASTLSSDGESKGIIVENRALQTGLGTAEIYFKTEEIDSSETPQTRAYLSAGLDNNTDEDGYIAIRTRKANSLIERLRIDAEGKVGIGVTEPSNKLSIQAGLSGSYNSTHWGLPSDVGIRSTEMTDNNYHSILQLASVRKSLTEGGGANGFIGFTTIDDSNASGIDDAARVAVINENGSVVTSPTALSFWTNEGGSQTNPATEKMRITSDGKVGIGTNGPLYKTTVRTSIDGDGIGLDKMGGSAGEGIQISARAELIDQSIVHIGAVKFVLDDNNSPYADGSIEFYSTNDGSFQKKVTISSVGNMTVTGTVTADSYESTSDERAKENIEDLSYGLEQVMQLRPVTFDYKSKPNKKRLGLIAQEAKAVVAEVVNTPENEDEMMSMSYSELVPVLIKGMQEQQAQIEALKLELEKISQ